MRSERRALALVGAGGHARVVADLIDALGFETVALVALEAPTPAGARVFTSDEDALATLDPTAVGVAIGVGWPDRARPPLRARLFELYAAAGFDAPPLMHPRAIVSPSARIGPGAQVMAGAVVQAAARIGANAVINTGASVDHDCVVGDHAHIAPGAVLCGGVRVGAAAFVGAGAVLTPGVRIDDAAFVRAGSTQTASPRG